jgi:hypothetical protein
VRPLVVYFSALALGLVLWVLWLGWVTFLNVSA